MSVFRELAKQRQAEEPAEDTTRCHAEHCPCRATVNLSGGRWTCGAHAFAKVETWPLITERLREHAWLIGFIDDVQRIEQERNSKALDWRAYATKFWTGIDEHCLPDPKEDCIPYQNRMRGELLYRIGQTKRPAPRLPQPPKMRGNVGELLGRKAA